MSCTNTLTFTVPQHNTLDPLTLAATIQALLDRAFAPDTQAWELSSDGTWHRNDGTVHLQETLIEAQRRRRTS